MIKSNAQVDSTAQIGEGTKIWDFTQIRESAVIGRDVIMGRNVYVGPGVIVGDNCKIQNHALIYEPAIIQNGVFIGPDVVLTNDQYPRAVNPDLSQKQSDDWKPQGVVIKTGASIGAKSVCVAPIQIGEWALVAAGSTVVKDVPAYALVAGNPAKRINWVGRYGVPLEFIGDRKYKCPSSGEIYEEIDTNTLVAK